LPDFWYIPGEKTPKTQPFAPRDVGLGVENFWGIQFRKKNAVPRKNA
jgi:hypothetical protein